MKSSSMKQKSRVIDGDKNILIVDYGLSYHRGNRDAYFSVTGEIWRYNEKTGTKTGRDCECCGCIHDEILEAFPNMADIIALHLADEDGAPLYAVENGFYFLNNPDKYPAKVLADHLRIEEHAAAGLIAKGMSKGEFTEYIYNQRARWAQEAAAVIAKYELRPEALCFTSYLGSSSW